MSAFNVQEVPAMLQAIPDDKPLPVADSAIALKDDDQLQQSGNFCPFHSQIRFLIVINIAQLIPQTKSPLPLLRQKKSILLRPSPKVARMYSIAIFGSIKVRTSHDT